MIVLSLPEVLFLLFSLGILLTYLFRNWARGSALFGGLLCGGLALWIAQAGPSSSTQSVPLLPVGVDVSARTAQFAFVFHLQPDNIPLVVISLGMVAVALLLGALARQSELFTPLVLSIAFGYTSLALLIDAPLVPHLLIPLFLVLFTAVGVFVLQADQVGRVAGPLRSLLPPLLAFPLFLPVGWYLEQIQLNPQNEELFLAVAWLLALGLLLLLAPVPLHGGQSATAQTAPPLATALLTLLYQWTVLSLFYQVVTQHQFVVEQTPLSLWLTVGGVITALWGGLAAAGTSHPGRLWGYALLHDWGLILLVLAVPGAESWPLVLFLFVLRAVSALTAAVGLAHLREAVGSLEPEWLQGAGGRLPWNSAAFLLGSLGLAGFPLSAGFTGHWAALQTVAETDWRIAAVVLVAAGGVVFGFVRLVRILFGPLENRLLPREHPIAAAVAVGVLLLTAGLSITPQLLQEPIVWALAAFSG